MGRQNHTCSLVFGSSLYTWDVYRLWREAKGLPVAEIALTAFDLDIDYWFDAVPSLRKVAEHCKQIMDADLAHPIIVNVDGRVMDGYHRLAKALLLGQHTIKAIKFSEMPLPDRVERQH